MPSRPAVVLAGVVVAAILIVLIMLFIAPAN